MARKLVAKRSRKAGKAPGTLMHIGQPRDDLAAIRVIEYDAEGLDDRRIHDAGQYHEPNGGRVAWLNVDGVHQADVIEALGKGFKLHPLVMEDILNTDQRPKVEDYDGYLYLVLRMLRFDEQEQQIHSEQLSLILGQHFVLSLQEHPGDVFDGVRERLRNGRRIRFMQADYLGYALLDAVVDHYFVVLEQLSEHIERLEDELIDNPTPTTLGRIHHFKREMLLLRKSIWPLREVLSRLSRDESPLISAETRLFLRDVYDHTIHVLDTIDTLRELLVGMLDLYLSSTSNRMNQVMKVLTIIATLFMPLTFLAGVYGMNFEHMPELAWPWAYPAVLVLMLMIAIGLLIAFRRRHWL
ncbi:magnesium/cobalt transporter CorA [Halopseudomonas phragmitis]|uniref:Magnesium transport protein CorA n=2 Tax=Pseudomonadaceae TaxID=135621 RepID=A0A1V0B703_9GAMM|nr:MULTISPECIES: magnesium/cobalt transporter CorA [Pseudomonadaceae]AQZ95697.1 magnesium and cobalt transport protein CorA [Halopseudomonas phragmitis]RHW22656.1 magnesium and cobalt transport protein CorA [Pseudomonas jilinensis]